MAEPVMHFCDLLPRKSRFAAQRAQRRSRRGAWFAAAVAVVFVGCGESVELATVANSEAIVSRPFTLLPSSLGDREERAEGSSDQLNRLDLLDPFAASRGDVPRGPIRHSRRAAIEDRMRRQLGDSLLAAGLPAAAFKVYRRAADEHSFDAKLLNNLGVACQNDRRPAEAAEFFRRAIDAAPGHLDAMNNLAWLLATCADDSVRNGAISIHWANRLRERVREVVPMHADTLAAAHAESGDFDRALKIADEARRLAAASNQIELAWQISQRIELYSQRVAYRESPGHEERSARELLTEEVRELAARWPVDVLAEFAWLFATHDDPRVHDGKLAVWLAELACQKQGSPSPYLRATLAAAYARAGRFAEAQHVQKGVEEQAPCESRLAMYAAEVPLSIASEPIEPRADSGVPPGREVAAYINVAVAESLSRQEFEALAVPLFQRAIRFDPSYHRAHLALGTYLLRQGKVDQGAGHLMLAAVLHDTDADVLNRIGVALQEQGRRLEAIDYYRAALEVNPNEYDPANNLAWLLATGESAASDSAEAIELAERVCDVTSDPAPTFLDTLSATYAAAGRFAEAVRTADRAIERARSMGNRGLADEIALRQKLYEKREPYRAAGGNSAQAAPVATK